jgi:hypothetical protein
MRYLQRPEKPIRLYTVESTEKSARIDLCAEQTELLERFLSLNMQLQPALLMAHRSSAYTQSVTTMEELEKLVAEGGDW